MRKSWVPDWMLRKAAVLSGPQWRMADGTLIRVRDMDNGHLLNTIRYIERRGNGFPDCDGDGKGNYTDPFADYDHFDPPAIYYDMTKEARRRGLDFSMPAFAANRIATPDEFPG